MAKEPVLWGKQGKHGRKVRAQRWDEKAKAWVPAVDDRGNPLYEKVPQIGFVGPLENAVPMKFLRSLQYLRADGHITHVCVTNAAAHVHGADESYLRDRRAKAKHFGWIEFGTCPCIEVMAGKLNAADLISETARNGKPCHLTDVGPGKAPCPHFIAEEKARKARRTEENRRANEQEKSEAAKQTEALVSFVEKVAGKEK